MSDNTRTSWLLPVVALLTGLLLSDTLSTMFHNVKASLSTVTSNPLAQSSSKSPPQLSKAFTLPASYSCKLEYTLELLSFDPLVFYVNNFMSEDEVNHVLEISKDEWRIACVAYSNDGVASSQRAPDEFEAEVASFSPEDPVAKCLSSRMVSLLGNIQHEATEAIRLVKYSPGDRFRLHTDRYETSVQPGVFDAQYGLTYGGKPHNRLLSSMVYLEDNCTGGETYFPDVAGVGPHADGTKFSRGETGGLLVKPKRGNAVFWNNFHLNGTGDDRLFHASLPVKSGTKVGLNMLSVYFPHLPMVGH
ncbi:hypothetical protein SCARD494_06799 [Seiridium cardinale]